MSDKLMGYDEFYERFYEENAKENCECFNNPPCNFCTDDFKLEYEEYLKENGGSVE